MCFSNLHRNQELVDKLSKFKLASINYPDKASLQPEPDNRRAGHSPALRILGAVTQTSPRDFSTGSLDSVRCTKLVSPETADATKLVKLESESKQQRTILSSIASHKVNNRDVIGVDKRAEGEECQNKNKTITGISTSEKVPSPKALSRLKSKDVILVHKRVAVLRRSEPKYKNRPTKQTCPGKSSVMKIIPASGTALHKVGTREVPIDVDKWAEEFERKNKNTEIHEQLNLEIILKAKPQWRAQGRCSTMMCMHPATNSWTPVPVDFSFTFVFTVTAARAVASGIHIPKVRPALRSDMARHPVHPPPPPQPQLPPPPPPPCSTRPVPLVSAPPLAQSQNISVVSLPPKAKPGHSFRHWRSAPPIIDDEADVPQVTVRPALQAVMVCRPVHPQPHPQFPSPSPPRSSRPVPLVSAPPLARSQKISVVSPPPMAMAKLEPSFRHWRSAPPIIDDDDDDEADDATNHNPKFNAAKHAVHENDDSAMDVDVDSANTDSRSDWRVSALAILLRQLSVEEGSSAIPFPYGIGIPAQCSAGTAAGSVPASSGPGPDASTGSDSTSGSTSGFGSGTGSGTGAPSVPVSFAPGARPALSSWAGGRMAWRLDKTVTKLTYWS